MGLQDLGDIRLRSSFCNCGNILFLKNYNNLEDGMSKIRSIVSAIALASSVSVASAWEALPTKAPAPANNPTTAEKVELGRILFHDPRLSSTGTVSCASCHNTMLGGEDNRPNSMGVNGQTGAVVLQLYGILRLMRCNSGMAVQPALKIKLLALLPTQ